MSIDITNEYLYSVAINAANYWNEASCSCEKRGIHPKKVKSMRLLAIRELQFAYRLSLGYKLE